uniref:Pentraxin family member n=1 Tax=Pseudonaja textilis TaxID=8673 RepID=A0A670YYH9_PSETE
NPHSLLALMVTIHGSSVGFIPDLERKAFVFPLFTNIDFVKLKVDLQKPLTSFTVCERFQTEVVCPFALFSYTTKDDDNEFLLHTNKPNLLSVFMKQGIVNFDISKARPASTCKDHLCFTWESKTGLAGLWCNGQPLPRKIIMKDQVVQDNASIILGQEQDSFGGLFDANQCFVGEIEDVYFWDQVLQPDEICRVWHNRVVPHPLIDWRELYYETHRDVIVQVWDLST